MTTFDHRYAASAQMLEAMRHAYVTCALWSTTYGEDGTPMEDTYGPDDLAPATWSAALTTCESFLALIADTDHPEDIDGIDVEQMGHDLWLTREGHGAGFWDRGLGDRGERLTKWAKTFGSADWYPGDDGLIYGSD